MWVNVLKKSSKKCKKSISKWKIVEKQAKIELKLFRIIEVWIKSSENSSEIRKKLSKIIETWVKNSQKQAKSSENWTKIMKNRWKSREYWQNCWKCVLNVENWIKIIEI